jgi:hypothetical protein
MMFAAYVDGGYLSLKGDIPAFNGLAELAPASSTTSATPMRFSLGKSLLPTVTPQLTLGEEIESVQF